MKLFCLKAFFISALLLLVFAMYACKEPSVAKDASAEEYNKAAADPAMLHACTQQLTAVIVHDVFKPPVASRIYAYSYLAAYEALRHQSEEHVSLAGKLNQFTAVPAPDPESAYCFPLAGVTAFISVGKGLTFNQVLWEEFEEEFYRSYQQMGMPAEVYDRSIAYGQEVAAHVLSYAGQDNYKETRAFRHTISYQPGGWEPTPPVYAEACEPQWNSIRSFTLHSAAHFSPPAPATYSLDTNSAFYRLTKEVYDIGTSLKEEQRTIAHFWDDNPFVTSVRGHAAFAEKKMTPPGHWIDIARTVSQQKQQGMLEAAETYTLTALALNDAFIACWDAKYKTDRIRPVTVINQQIDKGWMPFLETPGFPEYVSGHSSISAAAGRILTYTFGENVAFTDSTEYVYGHGVRSFASFEEAYWEASMSRVYGGIHYRDGVEQGTYLGERIGEWVWALAKGNKQKLLAVEPQEEPVLKGAID